MNPMVKATLRATRRHLVKAGNWLQGYDPVGDGTVPKSLKTCSEEACRVCGKTAKETRQLRIIYLLPSDDSPVGGNKVSYRECEIIANHGIRCFAFHPEKPGATYTWFSHRVETLKVGHFDPRFDFLVFSEVWAAVAAKFCVPAGLRYAIYVQNGYVTHFSAGFGPDVVRQAYEHADLVLSISADTTEMISVAYPFIPSHKILRIFNSVAPLFSPGEKVRLITYMPRKLRAHSERMCLYLRNVLPEGWRIQPIENLDERGVAALMSQSSIFLSFSELEGFGLPPIEAALSGNIVVGYTGQGAKEYFTPPVFREVSNGDFRSFVAQVLAAIEDVEFGFSKTEDFVKQRASLAKTYSVANETAHVMRFVARIRKVMGLD
jgi:glycosyltransferase involved in cell wall biosynthesis